MDVRLHGQLKLIDAGVAFITTEKQRIAIMGKLLNEPDKEGTFTTGIPLAVATDVFPSFFVATMTCIPAGTPHDS